MSSTEPPDAPVDPPLPPGGSAQVGAGETVATWQLPGLSLAVRSRPRSEPDPDRPAAREADDGAAVRTHARGGRDRGSGRGGRDGRDRDGRDRDGRGGAGRDWDAGWYGGNRDARWYGRDPHAAARTPRPPGSPRAPHTRAPYAVFVHGLGGSSQNWSALMRRLAVLCHCEAVDLPGFGDSPPPDDGNFSIAAQARTVIRYLDARGHGPVHLFGNSMGGAITTRVAAARPDLVRTLTLVSPALPELRPQRTAVPTGLLAVPGAAALFSRLTRDWTVEQRTRAVLALCYGDPGRVTPEEFAQAVAEYRRRLTLPYFWDVMTRAARGVVDAYTLGGQHSMWRQAERVLAPTLLVYGLRDQLVSYRMARRACAAFRDSRLLTLVDAGHVAMMEYPDAVAAAFRELLDEVDAQRPGGEDREGPGGRDDPAGPSARAAATPGAKGSGAARG